MANTSMNMSESEGGTETHQRLNRLNKMDSQFV